MVTFALILEEAHFELHRWRINYVTCFCEKQSFVTFHKAFSKSISVSASYFAEYSLVQFRNGSKYYFLSVVVFYHNNTQVKF